MTSLDRLRRIAEVEFAAIVIWTNVATFPFHFHRGDQDTVVAAPFALSVEQGFREFMDFVHRTMTS